MASRKSSTTTALARMSSALDAIAVASPEG
jgi:hypothetical protein